MAEKTAQPAQKSQALARDPMAESPDRPDGEMLPAELRRIQSQAADPKPPVAKLARGEAGRGDDPGPPRAVPGQAAPAPRVVHENERAPRGSGLTRFKMRALNYGGEQPWRYVLARDEGEARKEYLRATGLQAVLDAVGGKPDARFAVKALPD